MQSKTRYYVKTYTAADGFAHWEERTLSDLPLGERFRAIRGDSLETMACCDFVAVGPPQQDYRGRISLRAGSIFGETTFEELPDAI